MNSILSPTRNAKLIHGSLLLFVLCAVVLLSGCNFTKDLQLAPEKGCEEGETRLPDGECIVPPAICERYCLDMRDACTGENNQYPKEDGSFDEAGCMSACIGMEAGLEGDTAGDTVHCRIYHAGAAQGSGGAQGGPQTHCPHAGPVGAGVCQGGGSPCATLCTDLSESCGELLPEFEGNNFALQCQAECLGNGIPSLQAGGVPVPPEVRIASDSTECRQEAVREAALRTDSARVAFCREASPGNVPENVGVKRMCRDSSDIRSCANYCNEFIKTCGNIDCSSPEVDGACGLDPFITEFEDCLHECVVVTFPRPDETTFERGPLACRAEMLVRAADAAGDNDVETQAMFCREASHASPRACSGGRVCARYCNDFQELCTPSLGPANIPSPNQCFEACLQFDKVGLPGDTEDDSVACRETALGRVRTQIQANVEPTAEPMVQQCANAHPDEDFIAEQGPGTEDDLASTCTDE